MTYNVLVKLKKRYNEGCQAEREAWYDEFLERMYSIADDCGVAVNAGIVWVDFEREAASQEDADALCYRDVLLSGEQVDAILSHSGLIRI